MKVLVIYMELSYIYESELLSRVQLCDPIDYSPPGSSIHGILQARILEWVAMPFSRGSFQPRDRTQVSCITGGFFYHLSHQGSPVSSITCVVTLFLSGVNSMRHNDGPRGATQLTQTTNEDKLGFWQVMVKVVGCPTDNV